MYFLCLCVFIPSCVPSFSPLVRTETSWYSTEDTIYDKAVVHTKSKGKKQGELYLNPGDVLTDLEKVDIPGYWKVSCTCPATLC